MKKRRICLKTECTECGKKLFFLIAYSHPVEGRKKCVCGKCWERIDSSEKKYRDFIRDSIKNKKEGVVCFIMIDTKPKYEKSVCNALASLPGVKETYELLGKHDIIVKVEVDDYNKLGAFVTNNIRNIEGIKNTNTLTGSFSIVSKNLIY